MDAWRLSLDGGCRCVNPALPEPVMSLQFQGQLRTHRLPVSGDQTDPSAAATRNLRRERRHAWWLNGLQRHSEEVCGAIVHGTSRSTCTSITARILVTESASSWRRRTRAEPWRSDPALSLRCCAPCATNRLSADFCLAHVRLMVYDEGVMSFSETISYASDCPGWKRLSKPEGRVSRRSLKRELRGPCRAGSACNAASNANRPGASRRHCVGHWAPRRAVNSVVRAGTQCASVDGKNP